jgi:gamma-glutamyltranspeptidase/glutathione hydrolase
VAEATIPAAVRGELAARGHRVQVAEPWSQGQVTAVRINPESGCLEASATSRGQKAYALGW